MMCRHATITRHPHSAVRRGAYTLLELVIVLSVFGLLAGVSWPLLMRPWSKSRVQQAARELSRELLRTRLNAIEQGQVFRLRWRPGTAEYDIRAWNVPAREIELLSSDPGSAQDALPIPPTAQEDSATADTLEPIDGAIAAANDQLPAPSGQPATELLAGITFLDPDRPLNPADDLLRETTDPDPANNSLRSAGRTSNDDSARQTETTANLANTPWAPPVWFYPDGRTTNARWTLIADDGYQIDMSLRGWVGTVQVGPVLQRESLDARPEAGQPDSLRPERREPALP